MTKARNKTSPIVEYGIFCNSLSMMKSSCLLVLFFLSPYFLFSQDNSLRKNLLNEHIQLGKEFHSNGDYASALMEFNLAYGYLKRTSNHVLRDEISGLISDTKQKLIKTKKRKHSEQSMQGEPTLLSLDEEPDDFAVLQAKGKTLARKTWADLDELSPGSQLGVGRMVAVLPEGALEIKGNAQENYFLRASGSSAFTLDGKNAIHLHSGEYCLFTNYINYEIRILSSEYEFQVCSDTPYALLVEVSTPQEFLVSCILGRIRIFDQSNEKLLYPGLSVKVDPSKSFSIREFELGSSLVQRKLFCGLSEKPIFYPSFIKQANAQSKFLHRR